MAEKLAGSSAINKVMKILKLELEAKADLNHTHSYNDLTDKPEIPEKVSQLVNDSDFATNSEVDTKILNASLGGGGTAVDLTKYATKVEVNAALDDKSDIDHEHVMGDITDLNLITEAEATTLWANALANA